MGNSRHKRHLKVLASLVASGWKVEACYYGQIGLAGNVNQTGRQVFRPFRGFGRTVYYAPPDLTGGGKATFILARTVPASLPCPAVRRINGWKDLSAFAVQERRAKEAKARAEAKAKEGGAR